VRVMGGGAGGGGSVVTVCECECVVGNGREDGGGGQGRSKLCNGSLGGKGHDMYGSWGMLWGMRGPCTIAGP
jgi:hypothetical protein